ncbi:pentatricopeptide repeat-containing protein At3g04130, mitochondrial [Rhodamnia argentea]|uniref:Pentatricopeptide repeat-containing protein At3g04130, mitochondrial n=1 Tax=Rhodamnia argentea TaxID=178133 RepID=A0A8B8NYL1_9MYRT|nr:pentatricopeptide repeat-containing protein At3g04130, mitochondrial [Rhodamnia argentea]XP_030527643.1 pentatricopeptide repeat-containing protein At3g04130, mitochondrial [Rhodamnia argentea]
MSFFSSRPIARRPRISSFPSTRRATPNLSSYALRHTRESPTGEPPSDLEIVVSRVRAGSSEHEVLRSLERDPSCASIEVSHGLVEKLLDRFRDDWKSALGVLRWAGPRVESGRVSPEAYDAVVDILGKNRRMDRMREVLEEMSRSKLVRLSTVGKVMRRFAGAGLWEEAVKVFDELGDFGLEKNTEAMNLLLDTLCKERRVEQARSIMLQLKPHVLPDAHTFNILIFGWCKINRVDEAQWTMQEMKGHGVRPCVISYSTIVQFYCRQGNFNKVYQLFDEMRGEGRPPNVVTYTTVMHYLAKSEEFDEALQLAERMKLDGCEPDTLFYNCLIHVLARAGRVRDAVDVFEVEMPARGVRPNTPTYNTMISMFCHHGHVQKAMDLLKDMEDSNFAEPDVQTYYPLLKSCFKSGKTDGFLSRLLDDMVNKHHLSLDVSAYTLLIHGLCRADKADWAYLLFDEMVGQDITPRYQTCRLLLDEVKQKNMYDAAERIEDFMKKL